jgi:hypothetical protein
MKAFLHIYGKGLKKFAELLDNYLPLEICPAKRLT